MPKLAVCGTCPFWVRQECRRFPPARLSGDRGWSYPRCLSTDLGCGEHPDWPEKRVNVLEGAEAESRGVWTRAVHRLAKGGLSLWVRDPDVLRPGDLALVRDTGEMIRVLRILSPGRGPGNPEAYLEVKRGVGETRAHPIEADSLIQRKPPGG